MPLGGAPEALVQQSEEALQLVHATLPERRMQHLERQGQVAAAPADGGPDRPARIAAFGGAQDGYQSDEGHGQEYRQAQPASR